MLTFTFGLCAGIVVGTLCHETFTKMFKHYAKRLRDYLNKE